MDYVPEESAVNTEIIEACNHSLSGRCFGVLVHGLARFVTGGKPHI